ncbi:MAG: type I-C CRISPR-associated protein Cas8c/Csd1, partial [Oscillospiraceae bacterium]
RYYASASVTPKLVLGKLSALSQHHLAKLENRGQTIFYEKMLSEIACHIPPNSIPTSLNLEQQTEFALGYYQQGAAIYAPNQNSKNKEEI